MKKIVYSFGAFAALVLSASTLSSCQSKDMFDADFAMKEATQKYTDAFVQKYGAVDPNQNWDFCSVYEDITPVTRGDYDFSVSKINLGPGFWGFINKDKKIVPNAVDTAKVKDWNPYLSVELYPSFVKGTGDKYMYHHLGVVRNGQVSDITAPINVKNNNWYTGGNNMNHDSGRSVETRGLISEKGFYWVVYTTKKSHSDADDKVYNDSVMNNMAKNELKNYKELNVNGHVYWCFDTDGDKDYTDLICLVKNPYPLEPMCKRYMIEDLGSIGDFDFNDIVVDVFMDSKGKQKAIVRAMGGTLDFTLKIGDTEWTKGEKFAVTTMYNTKPEIDYSAVLDEFTVEGWNPDENNVSVLVKDKKSGDVLTIRFPKKGEAPMIVAVDPITIWMDEKVSIPTDWFYPIEISEVVEEDEE